jgi:predicted nucleic acid-binding protein
VKIADALRGVTRLFLDSAPVIYFVEHNLAYSALVDEVFDRIDTGAIQGVTSPVTLAECLVLPIQKGLTSVVQDFTDLVSAGANVAFVNVDSNIARHGAQIRADHNLKLADAFQAAVAFAAGCGALLTNDPIFKRVPGMPALILDDLEL